MYALCTRVNFAGSSYVRVIMAGERTENKCVLATLTWCSKTCIGWKRCLKLAQNEKNFDKNRYGLLKKKFSSFNYWQILQCLGSKGGCAILTVCTLLYQSERCLKRLTNLVPMAQTNLNYFWKHSKTKISNPWNVMMIECWFQFLVLTEQQYNMFSSDWFKYLMKLL